MKTLLCVRILIQINSFTVFCIAIAFKAIYGLTEIKTYLYFLPLPPSIE